MQGRSFFFRIARAATGQGAVKSPGQSTKWNRQGVGVPFLRVGGGSVFTPTSQDLGELTAERPSVISLVTTSSAEHAARSGRLGSCWWRCLSSMERDTGSHDEPISLSAGSRSLPVGKRDRPRWTFQPFCLAFLSAQTFFILADSTAFRSAGYL